LELENMDADKVAYSETNEVMAYFEAKYFLPELEKDPSRDEQRMTEPKRDGIDMVLVYPLRNYEKIGEAAGRMPSSRRLGIRLEYVPQHNIFTISFRIPNNVSDGVERIMAERQCILDHIGNINAEVRSGNEELRKLILERYTQMKKLRVQQLSDINSWISKLPVKLMEVPNGTSAPFRIPVNQKVLAIIPNKQKPKEPVLDRNQVSTIIELIRNVGHLFERTAKTFLKLEEEDLRDVILAGLNMVFKGEATGETFSKGGKTDIHLRFSSKDVLIAECKKWEGEKTYKETIDQLFRYTTWRDLFAIIVSFSNRQGFTDVIEKAKSETKRHSTYVNQSLQEAGTGHFITKHIKTEDEARQIEVHHLLFTLYVQE
jgi:hypothetical protein